MSFQVEAAEVRGGWVGCVLEFLLSDSFYEDIHTAGCIGQPGVGFSDTVHLYLLLLRRSVFSKAKPSGWQGGESGDERSEDEETSLQHHFGSPSVFHGQFSAII